MMKSTLKIPGNMEKYNPDIGLASIQSAEIEAP